MTGEAADRLGTSKPTVRILIDKGLLRATKQPRGSRFVWRVEERSLDAFLVDHGRYEGRSRSRPSRVTRIEAELSTLREVVHALDPTAVPNAVDAIGRERDELRAQVVNLKDALARSQDVAELQRDADTERAVVIEHLLAAAAANERADALRRQALLNLEEALAAFARPGHPGEMR